MRTFTSFFTQRSSHLVAMALSLALGAALAGHWTRDNQLQAQAVRSRMTTGDRQVLSSLETAFVALAEQVEPSVVTVTARSAGPERAERTRPSIPPESIPPSFRDFFRDLPPDFFREMPDDGMAPSTGSGAIVRQNGSAAYVLTNNHVIRGRGRFRVRLIDRTDYPAELVGYDEKADLAVLKFTPTRPLREGSVATLGDSDRVRVGQFVAAIGSPLGYESTFTVGVVSAKGRELRGLGTSSYSDLIQTDASINRGNSGGPLVNIDGEVIGINVAIASAPGAMGNIGIGFAIPSNTARSVVEQLIASGKVVRGYFGVGTLHREMEPELKEHFGVSSGALIESVSPDGPAARAGLQPGDVVVRFANKPVDTFTDLENLVAQVPPGSTVPVIVMREGKQVSLRVTVVERPSEEALRGRLTPNTERSKPSEPEKVTNSKFGLSLGTSENRVVVAGVAPGSGAQEEMIESGDVLVSVGRTAVRNVEHAHELLTAAEKQGYAVLRLETRFGTRYVVLRG
ncbi:MAG: trypsin-like peptidase domain-containing protein [Armatimonadetes bacterium]|nr:trypsin-like peptidase domain-containing protein [Armatimonadota bacterium]